MVIGFAYYLHSVDLSCSSLASSIPQELSAFICAFYEESEKSK